MDYPNCSQHGRPANRLCGLKQCCLLMCEHCLPQHFAVAGHRTALLLSPQALNFFESFTGYTHYKMFDWLDRLRRHGFYSLFEAGETNEGGQAEAGELTALGLHEFVTIDGSFADFDEGRIGRHERIATDPEEHE